MAQLHETHPYYNHPLMRESVDILNLSNRASNALRGEKILLIGHLMFFSEKTLLGVPNLGRKSITEIVDALAVHDLELGITPIESLWDFRATDIEAYYCLEGKLSTIVSLPAKKIEGMSDEEVLTVIQGTCQAAFDFAVLCKMNAVMTEFAASSSLNLTPIAVNAEIPKANAFLRFERRKIEVPLKCPAALTAVFKQSALRDIAKSLSGSALYEVLKPKLDEMSSKPA